MSTVLHGTFVSLPCVPCLVTVQGIWHLWSRKARGVGETEVATSRQEKKIKMERYKMHKEIKFHI